jgi:hypothetical protein
VVAMYGSVRTREVKNGRQHDSQVELLSNDQRPIEKIDIPSWCLALSESEYQACSPAHCSAGVTIALDGRPMSMNVGILGGNVFLICSSFLKRREKRVSGFSTRCIGDIVMATTRLGSTSRLFRKQRGRVSRSNTVPGAAKSGDVVVAEHWCSSRSRLGSRITTATVPALPGNRSSDGPETRARRPIENRSSSRTPR